MDDDPRLDAIRELLAAPRPAAPVRDSFADENAFEEAWTQWQVNALQQATGVLDGIDAIVRDEATAEHWVPAELVAITMLRAAIVRERDLPESSRIFDDAELQRATELAARLDPVIRADVPNGVYRGRASAARHEVPPGSYPATELTTGRSMRLLVGHVAGRVAGEASAAVPVDAGDRDALDRITRLMATARPGPHHPLYTGITEALEGTGRFPWYTPVAAGPRAAVVPEPSGVPVPPMPGSTFGPSI